MDDIAQKALLLAAVRVMIAEVTERIGDSNPYLSMDLDSYSISDLNVIKRTLHEILYAPPTRR
jgi:hypothetical protein